MSDEHTIRRYRTWYSRLLRLYPRPYHARFGEGMEQTFHDLCRERSGTEGGLTGFILWAFIETSTSILRENFMNRTAMTPKVMMGWLFSLVVFTIGVLNIVLVHPVPGIAYLLVSLVFLPPVNVLLKSKAGFSVPLLVQVILAVIIVMFTLGVSDLGDMFDKWAVNAR